MKRLCFLSLTAAVVALATARISGGDPLASSKPELDPQEVFRLACDRLKNLEAKHAALKGVSKVKPRLEFDDSKLKSAGFVFEENAVPPGKNPAKAKDEAKPFFYVSISIWSGQSQQPPAGLYGFQWKGQEYQAWVQVYGSEASSDVAVETESNWEQIQEWRATGRAYSRACWAVHASAAKSLASNMLRMRGCLHRSLAA
ncbi:MAG: hypothetical protein L0Y72_22950 [Gemmataceae bacterium]|nr:hypothetical protein [Gemmataceae bacterium]MCI0741902.1 hypothetical protein [Gemmataceae bacterium]